MIEIQLPDGAEKIIDTLLAEGFESYVVGGCVRDSLLGKSPNDWDICTSAKPMEIKQRFAGYHTIDTGIQHGTVTVVMDDGRYEVTTFRVDGEYSDNRRPDRVEFVHNVIEDLSRRDFTMNAMAYNKVVGLVDPFDGMKSLNDKQISCVGNPDERFNEDPLRILRALRFASTYGFSIEKKTSLAIHLNAVLLNLISAERINSELCNLLLGENTLNVLLEYPDVISTIIPEMKPCIGFEQNNKFHQYSVYDHIAHAVSNYHGNDITVLVALLLHDIGKPECYIEDDNGGHFPQHGIVSYGYATNIVSELRFDNKKQHDIAELVLYHDATIEPTKKIVKKWLSKIGEEQYMRLMDVKLSDILAHADGTQDSRIEKRNACVELAHEIIKEYECFTIKKLDINGLDVMGIGIPEGKIVGNVLKVALDGVIGGIVKNENKQLLKYIQEYLSYVSKKINIPSYATEPSCPFRYGFCNEAFSECCYDCRTSREEFGINQEIQLRDRGDVLS